MTAANGGNALHALDYIEAMLGELQPMASAHKLAVLAHLIEMARIEARDSMSAIKVDLDKRNGTSGVAL